MNLIAFTMPALLLATLPPAVLAADCAPTPLAAAQRTLEPDSHASSQEGYRIAGAVVDRTSGKLWLRAVSCSHPERPATLVPLNLTADTLLPSTATLHDLLIRTGEQVRIHFHNGASQVDLTGTAESSGGQGDRVAVALKNFDTSTRHVNAQVSARGEAELLP